MAEFFDELIGDVGVDFEAAVQDTGANMGFYIFRMTIEVLAHEFDGAWGDFLESAAPAGVDVGDDLANGVVEENGLAIGSVGREGDAGEVSNEAVGVLNGSVDGGEVVGGNAFNVGSVLLTGVD